MLRQVAIRARGGKPPRVFFAAVLSVISLAFILSEGEAAEKEGKKPKAKPLPTPYEIPGLIALGPSDAVQEDFAGLRVGMSMAEVRERMRALNAIDVAEETIAEGQVKSATKKLPDRGYDEGGIRKRGWKMAEGPFEWMTVTSNRRGMITLFAAGYRPEHSKPFSEIANLEKAAVKSEQSVTWNVLRPTGNYLITATGADGKAKTVSVKLAETNPIFVPATKPTPAKDGS